MAKVKKDLKKNQTKKSEKAVKESFVSSIRKEMKLVNWPTLKDVVKYTLATVAFILFISAFFLLLNAGLTLVKGWLA